MPSGSARTASARRADEAGGQPDRVPSSPGSPPGPISLGLAVLLLLVVTCGLFLRFYNLDRKLFWEDEAFTRARVAGCVSAEIRGSLLATPELRVGDLHPFQRISPARGFPRVLIAAAADPKHPPLYFVALWAWLHVLGDSDHQARLFSALISVVALPCLYWLCREL